LFVGYLPDSETIRFYEVRRKVVIEENGNTLTLTLSPQRERELS